jgi:vacuolar-type H+-ATPase subunit I/STV1
MKKHSKVKYIILTFFIATLLALNPSCNTFKRSSKQVREAEKTQKNQEKQAAKEFDEAIKKHREQQSDYAKQLMKDMKKCERQNNKVRKRSLRDRNFNNKCFKRRFFGKKR